MTGFVEKQLWGDRQGHPPRGVTLVDRNSCPGMLDKFRPCWSSSNRDPMIRAMRDHHFATGEQRSAPGAPPLLTLHGSQRSMPQRPGSRGRRLPWPPSRSWPASRPVARLSRVGAPRGPPVARWARPSPAHGRSCCCPLRVLDRWAEPAPDRYRTPRWLAIRSRRSLAPMDPYFKKLPAGLL